MKLIPGEKKKIQEKEEDLGRKLTRKERIQLHKKAKRAFIVKSILGIGVAATVVAGGVKALGPGKENKDNQIESTESENEVKDFKERYKVSESNMQLNSIEQEVDNLETKDDVLKFIKDRYIENYEQQTGDTTLTTKDIEITPSHENYVYIDESTGEIITHGEKPYETEAELDENGVSYSVDNDGIRTYKVWKLDKENQDNKEVMDCMTVENGERVRVIPGESYSEMKDYKSVLAEMSPEEWKVISAALDYHSNFNNDKETEKEKFKNRLIEALKAEQEAKQEQTNQTNRGIEDEGR